MAKVYIPGPDEHGRTDIEVETGAIDDIRGTMTTHFRSWRNPDGSRGMDAWSLLVPHDLEITISAEKCDA